MCWLSLIIDGVFVDYLVIFFALVFYALLIVVYLLRAHQSKLEWKLNTVFSLQLIPFVLLWVVNLLIGNDSRTLGGGTADNHLSVLRPLVPPNYSEEALSSS